MALFHMLLLLFLLVCTMFAIVDAQIMFDVHHRPSAANCTEKYFVHKSADHFRFSKSSLLAPFKQRYFVCDIKGQRDTDVNGLHLPILFYFGNEDDVTLYVNNTGFMWELGHELPASKLIFAEHRFYGKSIPTKPGKKECENLDLFTTEQALLDFAALLYHIKYSSSKPIPIIGFGGSYGGMMAYWFRMKYPHLIDGVLAGSAPIMAFSGIGKPEYDDGGFAEIVTLDASESRGSHPQCVSKFKDAMKTAWEVDAKSDAGRKRLSKAFRLCETLKNEDDAHSMIQHITDPWNYYAMGSYPYPSAYMTHGERNLPPFPIREACKLLVNTKDPYDGLYQAAEMFLNTSQSAKDFPCVSTSQSTKPTILSSLRGIKSRFHSSLFSSTLRADKGECKGGWDYQWCSEMFMPSSQGNEGRDMFWPPSPFNVTESKKFCEEQLGVISQDKYVAIEYGGWKGLRRVTNVILSNGLLDPWSAGGVFDTKKIPFVHPSVVSIVIPNGGHHTDLMFSHPMDTPDIKKARELEKKHIKKWILEAYFGVTSSDGDNHIKINDDSNEEDSVNNLETALF